MGSRSFTIFVATPLFAQGTGKVQGRVTEAETGAPIAWAVSNQLVRLLAGVPTLADLASDGFAMVLVLTVGIAGTCGAVIDVNAVDCPRCGVRQPGVVYQDPKSRPLSIVLALLLGGALYVRRQSDRRQSDRRPARSRNRRTTSASS